MKDFIRILAVIVGLTGIAKAQTVTLTAAPTSAIGSTPVTLTWSTTPTATSCTASGDWTGSKGASGNQSFVAVTASKSYVLTCVFPTTVTVPIQWTPPTLNSDNSPLTNLASYKVYFGTSATTLSQAMTVTAPASGTAVMNVANGSWFFAVTAISSTGKESAKSNIATKTVAALSANATAAVTVTQDTTPSPPTDLTVVEPTAFNVRSDYGRFVFLRGSKAGTARLGAKCDKTRATADGYTAISRPRSSVVPKPAEGVVLIAKCGKYAKA